MQNDTKLMQTITHFSSESYHAIKWHDIFQQVCNAVSAAAPIHGLINKNNYVLLVNIKLTHSITLINNNGDLLSVGATELKNVACKFLSYLDLSLYCLKNKNDALQQSHTHVHYILFLGMLTKEIKTACQTILLYTQEHLSNRYYYDVKISQLDVVQAEIAEVVILFSKLNTCSLHNINDIHFALSQYALILKLLSRLAGARAVLKHNALELLFYLNFFLNFSKEIQ